MGGGDPLAEYDAAVAAEAANTTPGTGMPAATHDPNVMDQASEDMYGEEEAGGMGMGLPIMLLLASAAFGLYAFKDTVKEAFNGPSRLSRPQAQTAYTRVPADVE